MIEHWDYAHELNKISVDLVEFLASNCRFSRHKLNSRAAACASSEKKASNDDSDIKLDVASVPLKGNAENKLQKAPSKKIVRSVMTQKRTK